MYRKKTAQDDRSAAFKMTNKTNCVTIYFYLIMSLNYLTRHLNSTTFYLFYLINFFYILLFFLK